MKIELPDINEVIDKILPIQSTFDGNTRTIREYIQIQRGQLEVNQGLYRTRTGKNDITILIIMLNDLLMRAMRGERGSKIRIALEDNIKSKVNLNERVYKKLLQESQYRFPNDGVDVISNVVKYFRDDLEWNWQKYFSKATRHSDENFTQDHLLTIKGISFKVRDLALSNFNENYVANDLHLVRVTTRLGLLNYGFHLLTDTELEMGNNPTNDKNYLFLHKLFMRLSELTGNTWKLSDFDRMFWHFGRTICHNKPVCGECPLNTICLTGTNIKQS